MPPVRYTVTYLRHSILADAEKITEDITQIQLARILNNNMVTLLEAKLCMTPQGNNI